ncbi:MAG: winged helix-turn-helix domain-containing protein, partial [Ktedonobacterales bacterium]
RSPAPLGAGDLRLDVQNQVVIVGDQEPAHLTKREFRLIRFLRFLVANSGRTIPAERLTSHVWGYECAGDHQLLKQIVHHVRRKIERDPIAPTRLLTVPGIGYRLQPCPPTLPLMLPARGDASAVRSL